MTHSIDVIDRFSGGYRFLSNFYDEGGITNEHRFQATKAMSTDDYYYVLAASSPKEAKTRGREIIRRPSWDNGLRDEMMRYTLRKKFSNEKLRKMLLSTGDSVLIEGNTWHDNYWGNCTCGRKSCQPTGQNMLGKILMELRDEYRAEQA